MRTMTRRHTKRTPEAPRTQYLFVQEPEAGEEVRIYTITGTTQHRDAELLKPRTRLFREGIDSRGREVKVMFTYGLREGTWHPETEGSYFIAFTGERPEHLSRHQLHFGSVSTPQQTKAAAHRIYLDIIEKTPELAPFLKCVKMPCVFCKDHQDAPGGSSIDIALETLPPPCGKDQVSRFYM